MKVVAWIGFDEADTKESAVGGLGGWFGFAPTGDFKKEPMRWEHYLGNCPEEDVPYVEAIRQEVLEKRLKIAGDQHQSSWIPLFEDGKVGIFSFRGWGDLMAAIWSEEENKDYNYMDFYMA